MPQSVVLAWPSTNTWLPCWRLERLRYRGMTRALCGRAGSHERHFACSCSTAVHHRLKRHWSATPFSRIQLPQKRPKLEVRITDISPLRLRPNSKFCMVLSGLGITVLVRIKQVKPGPKPHQYGDNLSHLCLEVFSLRAPLSVSPQ